ncbi:MAG TPA: hypothetical protein VF432_26720 [Thermoanaerobaculia bacterium]
MRAAGLAALACYAIHAAVHLHRGEPYDLLWSCHIAALLVGLGLLLRNATLNAIGFLWSCLGLPLWLLDLATGGTFLPTSALTHLGAFALGLFGVRRLGMPRQAALKALGAFVALCALCRAITPPAANVNLAFRVHGGWEPYFSSYALYAAMLLVLAAAIFAAVERAA